MTYLWEYFKEGEKMKNVEKIKPTGLFTNYIYKAIPLAFDESMSYYETLCGLLSYLKDTVIPTLNNNADAIIEVQSLITQLQDYVDNYFKNLDVQQEINNKLDAMAQDGTLQEIIANYLNSKAIFGFDNVASMKQATNLINGSYAKTLGFYNKNDGGSALYKIRNITNDDIVDNATIIPLDNNQLIGELCIQNDTINIKQFGCFGDNITDDTVNFQKCINFCCTHNKNLFINDGIYCVTGLSITSPIKINGIRTSTIKNTSNNTPTITINQVGGQTNYVRTFINDIILENNNQIGLNILSGNINITNYVRFNNSDVAINLIDGNIYVNDIRIDYANIGMYLASGDNHINNVTSHNCVLHYKNNGGFNIFKNIHGWNFDSDTKDWTTNSTFMEINTTQTQIINCYVDTLNKGFDIKSTSQYLLLNIQNLTFFINRSSYSDSKPKPIFFTPTNGKVNINSFECDFNGYVGDGNGNIVDYPNNIRIDNFIGNGAKFNQNIYYHDEIEPTPTSDQSNTTADILYNEYSYLTANVRKLIRKNNSRYLHFEFSLKKELPNNTEIWNVTFRNRCLGLNNIELTCYAYTSSGYFPLYAYVENNNLHIWNKSGDTINNVTGVILNGVLEKTY